MEAIIAISEWNFTITFLPLRLCAFARENPYDENE